MSILKSFTQWLNKKSPSEKEKIDPVIIDPPKAKEVQKIRAAPIEDDNAKKLEELSEYVKNNFPRLRDPNYLKTAKFSPQWARGYGDDMYYQLPNRKVIATRKNDVITFNPEGIEL